MAKGAHGSSSSDNDNNNSSTTTTTTINHNTRAPNDLSQTLSDGEGGTFPCQIPPTTDFEYYGRPTDGNGTAAMSSPKPNEEPTTTSDSYFDKQPTAEDARPNQTEKDRSRSLPFSPVQMWQPRRTNTAPAHGGPSSRPGLGPKASTLLGGLKRTATGGGITNSHSDAPYSYQFDPMSSDSDLSSDDEDSPPNNGSDNPQRPPTTETTDFAAAEERKKQEKKGRSYTRFNLNNDFFKSKGRVSKRDGRLNISISEAANSGYIAKALSQSIKHHLDVPRRKQSKVRQRQEHDESIKQDSEAEAVAASLRTTIDRPCMNIVVMVIGSRGDIQPFIKVGKILKHQYGHRVRIASHPTFRDFVEKESGLEFFSVGGDPSELMAFMVKNPGLIPNLQTIREGEIQCRRSAMAVMFEGFWRACINTTDDEKDGQNLKMMGDKAPFVADAIIANPPSMAHVHIAEKLGIPLHMMFTFPYSPTQAFPHPLANIKQSKSNVDANYVNFMSYPLVEMMTWQGLGDIVNRFRERTLGLEPVSSLWAPGALYRMKVPYTYLWSPSLVPKPNDWGPEIDIAGFVFLEMANNFQPPKELTDFLEAGDMPIYIGFGSIVVDDPDAFTNMIFDATKKAGVRALVNKGWGGLGGDDREIPDHIHMLGNTPHDWLFPRVKAVVHHGGAGTTAIGLKLAKPTMIVPFFGDQPFWGAMVADAKAGAHECVPYKRLNADKLAEGIKQCLTEESQQNVQRIADSISNEGDGAENAVKSFHRSLPLAGRANMRCSILEDRVAVWQLRGSSLRLSALAAEILHEKGKIKWGDLKLLRVYEWNDFDGPGEPITGTAGALKDSLYDIGEGVGMVPVRVAKHIRKHEEHERKKREIQRRKEERKSRKAEQKGKSPPSSKDGHGAPAENGNASRDQQPQRPQAARENTENTLGSAMSADPADPLYTEVGRDAGEGFKRSGFALLSMPNDLHVAIAQGFHNAPRLWGDATVRKPVRITGFKSGWVAARREFGYGIYDGWTGLVTQPYGDFKDGVTVPAKLAGLGVGFGKGLGGFVVKNVSAVVAPPAFVGKGLLKYMEKHLGAPEAKPLIRRAHILQGQKDMRALQQSRKPSTTARQPQLKEIEHRVTEGWKVYEEIWHEAQRSFKLRHNPFQQAKLERERRAWEQHGALENIETAKRALHARRQGHNLDKVFAKRRREMSLAEAPRASAMTQPEPYEKRTAVLPNGQEATSSSESPAAVGMPDDEQEVQQIGKGEQRQQEQEGLRSQSEGDVPKGVEPPADQTSQNDEDDSDATAVGEEQEVRPNNKGSTTADDGVVKFKGHDDDGGAHSLSFPTANQRVAAV
ncbi:UDP-Glycosyltransferase/glycogen phosphorylase [Hortaea werneckii]|nr:UDP-Glycosyltransferase/glycogen phosphorylase [Hortaea werneckii]